VYCASASNDLIEPMQYIHQQYCRDSGRKLFVIGFSLGANILANALGKLG
jgi:predicted alpha/beta-fold hydrolase